MRTLFHKHALIFFSLLISCKEKNSIPANDEINALNLKKGNLIVCGPSDKQFGTVAFDLSCSEEEKQDFNLATSLLHSFEYDEAEKVFAKIIDKEPGCAMAYWGVAMCNYHPLWSPPTESELKKGLKAIEIGRSVGQKSKRESAYIEAIGMFYKDFDKLDHRTRCINLEKAMEDVYLKYPNDKEAAIFYALALDAAADPTDKSYTRQRKAGSILSTIYKDEPNHPGIVHYIIHSYDFPGLAVLALPAARQYASIAPASSHAQHMPSHIFTRLGLWDECIHSNLVSTSSAKCYAETAGIKGHWDEEFHGMDYLVYAYLQKAENTLAKKQWDYLTTINEAYPANFKVAYAFAAIPSRYLLENKMWKEAAHLKIHPANFAWEKFTWQKAIVHFTRLLGFVHLGSTDSARSELKNLQLIYDGLIKEKDTYKANQVAIQIKASNAWILLKEGKNEEALALMNAAADMEDATEKHPVTPGEVIPARELLGDMLMQMNNPGKALEAYRKDLEIHPNRFNGLYNAGLAAEKSGNFEKADFYYRQLLNGISPTNSERPELAVARLFLKNH